MAPIDKIAFLGIGLMGGPMARNLLHAGFAVTVWNRTHAKAQPLAAAGAHIAETPSDAICDADIIITMVADGQTVSDILFAPDTAAAFKSGSLVIDMSSIKPSEARAHAKQLASLNVAHLDAPVSGGTKGAEAGTLAIMAGGAEADFSRAKPVFEAMGRAVHVGPDGTGQLCKLANQAIVAATIGIVAEATLLAQKGGADPAALRAALQRGFADSTILQQHGERMSTHNFTPGGPSKFQLKDLNNTLEAADAENLHLPMTLEMRNRFQYLIDTMDGGDLDHSALYLELLEQNKMQAE